MSHVLTDDVSPEDLKRFETIYNEQCRRNNITVKAQFEYACCLVRSKYRTDMQKGIILLESLCNTDRENTRDYLFYLAIGHARLKEYTKALHFTNAFLSLEPANQQVTELEAFIKKERDWEGMKGIATSVAGIAAIGAVCTLAAKFLRK